jgi:predicted phosphoribosyltransferase
MFDDRTDAGKKLAKALEKYKGQGVLVLAIPRGGVEVAYQVARYLEADLSIIVSRKLPTPGNPESGFGAIAEDGSLFIWEHAKLCYSKETIAKIIEQQGQEIKRRIEVLRKGKPLPEIKDKTVILVDDGIAMGSTMRTSIMLCKKQEAKKIIVATPVSGVNTAEQIGSMVDEVVILEKPPFFQAVAQVYENWYDVSDEEVLKIMERWGKKLNQKL